MLACMATYSHISALANLLLTRRSTQRVAKECGLLDVLPAHWVSRVDGVLPASGYRINWDGLWAELSSGVSLENLVHRGSPPAVPAAVLDLLHRRLSKPDVLAAATFDLLTSQCDRHGQNVYVSKDGRLSLIDNDQAYGSSACWMGAAGSAPTCVRLSAASGCPGWDVGGQDWAARLVGTLVCAWVDRRHEP